MTPEEQRIMEIMKEMEISRYAIFTRIVQEHGDDVLFDELRIFFEDDTNYSYVARQFEGKEGKLLMELERLVLGENA